MLNFLRADLYRLRRSGVAIGLVLFILGLVVFIVGLSWGTALAAGGDISMPGSYLGESALASTADNGFVSGYLPLLSAYASTYLIASDWKSRGCKSLLSVPGARGRYLASKFAVAALLAVAMPAVMFISFAVVPVPFGLAYTTPIDVAETLGWWGLAALVCFGYAAVCTCVAVLSGNETLAWVSTMFVGLGIIGNGLNAGLWLVGFLAPALADAMQTAAGCLLVVQSTLVGLGAGALTAPAAELVRAVAVSLGWTAASAFVGWLAFRRRAL